MNLNEITNTHFEYSLVSDETAKSLKAKKNQLDGIYFRYTSEVGQVLYEAQQELADYNNDGLFAKWVEAAGFKRQRAYEYINIYKYAVRITDNEELEIFEKQPKSIQTEISKPSAIPEVNEAVMNGDIKTHKEYKELEKQLKQKDELIESMADSMHDFELHAKELADENEQLKNKPAEVIEREVVIEKVPDDYHQLKEQSVQSQSNYRLLKEQYNKLVDSRKEVDEKSRKYEELSRAIQEMEGKMSQGQKRIQAQKDVYDLVRSVNKLITETAPLTYLIDTESVLSNEYAQKPIEKIIDNLRDMANRLEKNIKSKIIEGEIIND